MILAHNIANFTSYNDGIIRHYYLEGVQREIFIYAKHLRKGDESDFDELRPILAKAYGYEPDCMSNQHIYSIVSKVYAEWSTENDKESLIHSLYKELIYTKGKGEANEIILELMLSHISLITMIYPDKELHFDKQ